MESLNITIETVADKPFVFIVHFEGEFDGYAKDSITDVQDLVDKSEEKTTLVFDFEKLNYMNSYAIGHLIAWRNQLSNSQSRLFITGIKDEIRDALDAVGSSILFTFFPDVQSAVEGL